MTETPRSYTERRDLIARKLEPYFHVSRMVPTNTEASFEEPAGSWGNSLVCRWGDAETLTTRTLSVCVYQVADGEREAASVREMMLDEAPPSPDRPPPDADAYEIAGQDPGEYVFVLNYLGRLTAIVGDCAIDIAPNPSTGALGEIADAALDIARTVGCSAYVDDFQPPVIDPNRDFGAWTTADGLVYDPRTPPSR